MPKSPEQPNQFSEEEALKEASEMKEIIESGRAMNYTDAEKQIEREKRFPGPEFEFLKLDQNLREKARAITDDPTEQSRIINNGKAMYYAEKEWRAREKFIEQLKNVTNIEELKVSLSYVEEHKKKDAFIPVLLRNEILKNALLSAEKGGDKEFEKAVRDEYGKDAITEENYTFENRKDPAPFYMAAHVADLFEKAGKPEKAKEVMERFITLQPSNARGWAEKGRAYKRLGDQGKSKEMFESAATAYSEKEIFDEAAKIYGELGDNKKAAEMWLRNGEQCEKREFFASAAEAYYNAGQIEKAREMRERYRHRN